MHPPALMVVVPAAMVEYLWPVAKIDSAYVVFGGIINEPPVINGCVTVVVLFAIPVKLPVMASIQPFAASIVPGAPDTGVVL